MLTAGVSIATFVVLGGALTLAERLAPARVHHGRARALTLDTVGLLCATLVSAFTAEAVAAVLPPPGHWVEPEPLLASVLRGAAFFVLSDLSRYLAHRALHSAGLWPSHRFHHSVAHLDWFAGNRAAPLHAALFVAPTAALAWALDIGPTWVALNAGVCVVWNHLMHTNVRIPAGLQRAAERLVTTPRYHHLHHALEASLGGSNLGSILTVWDRVFGTFVHPDRVAPDALVFGLRPSEQRPAWRLLLGL